MKIKHNSLKKLYKGYLEDQFLGSRDKCPSPQDFIAHLRDACSKKKKNQIIDHVTQCPECLEELKFVLKTIREEEKFISDLKDLIPENKQSKKNKYYPQLISFRPLWIYGLIIISGAVLISHLVRNISQQEKYRGNVARSVTLISPTHKTEQKTQMGFKWEDVQESDYFILEIFDESLYPVWTSDKIKENYARLSEEITGILIKDKIYYWMVTAFLSDGKTIESRLQEFFISD
jgi:hypothetical protein